PSPLTAESRPRPARTFLVAPPRAAPTDRPVLAGPNRPAAGQYVIAERDVLIVAAFDTSQLPLVRDGTPICVGLGLVFATREGVLLQFATVFGHGGRRRRGCRRALGSFGSRSVS